MAGDGRSLGFPLVSSLPRFDVADGGRMWIGIVRVEGVHFRQIILLDYDFRVSLGLFEEKGGGEKQALETRLGREKCPDMSQGSTFQYVLAVVL